MALLSNTTYNRLGKSLDESRLILLNEHGEFHQSGTLEKLVRTKSKINTRWNMRESTNLSPFTHAALTIKGRKILVSAIQPIQKVGYGYFDIQYESDD